MKKYFSVMIVMILAAVLPNAFADPDLGDTSTGNITEIINCDKNTNNSARPPAIPALKWQGSGLITVWFDDAWLSAYTHGYPLMKKYGFHGAIAIAVKLVCYPEFMNWDQLRTLQQDGWEPTAHSVMHDCDLGYYTTKTTEYEIKGSKQLIEKHGMAVNQFVMPCGYGKEDYEELFQNHYPPIIKMAKEYFKSYRTTHYKRINSIPVLDPYNLNAFQVRNTTPLSEVQAMIDKAVKEHGWLIIVIHQIDDTGRPFSIPVEKFNKILAMIKKSKLPVVLPDQVLNIKR